MAQITLNTTGVASNGSLVLQSNGTTAAVTVDTSQNVGVGVTPSTWSTGKAIQVGTLQAAIWGAGDQIDISGNAYFNSGWKAAATKAGASLYEQALGVHSWSVSGAVTAGNAITFTQAMTLDASGKLLLGVTSGTGLSNGDFAMGNGNHIRFRNAANSGYISAFEFTSANGLNIGTGGSLSTITFGISGIGTVATFDTSGALLLGGPTAFENSATRLQAFSSVAPAAEFSTSSGSTTDAVGIWNRATTGDNQFIGFYTEASATRRGSITYNRAGGLVAYNVTSDYRAKDISGPVINSGALIDSVPVYMGTMKGATQERPMFIAHETPVYAHTGEKDAVDKDGNPVYQQMDASSLIPVMWAEIQSLRKRLATLESA